MTESAASKAPAEQGDPASDGRAFRRVLGQFATGVTVVGTVHEGRGHAMTVNSFSAVSLAPPLVLWSIRKESGSAAAFRESGHFSVNVLEESQTTVSNHFGRPREEALAGAVWAPGIHGDPLLDGCLAHLECTTHSVADGGDHLILIGQVERYTRFDGKPLVFAQGEYGWFGRRSSSDAGQPAASTSGQLLFTSLLREAEQHMSTLFDTHRRELGLTPPATRILNHLLTHDRDTVEGIQSHTPIGRRATDDGLAELETKGLVHRNPAGTWGLTDEGRTAQAALRRGAEAFTDRQLEGIPADDLEAAERVLTALRNR